MNQFTSLIADRDTNYKSLIQKYDILHSDGTGVYLASKFLYGSKGLKEKLTGTDLYSGILELANLKKLKCFFLGGSETAIKNLDSSISEKYSNVNIVGKSNRFTTLNENLIENINNSGADILFIGLGTPLQEEWLITSKENLNIPVMITVGSGIDFIAGTLKRAPEIIQKLGFEWLYRFFKEPRRLFFRYFLGIPIFIFKVIVFKFKLLFKK
jgi:N-acetylglucosaminyldiphosphoundecaprenol N-acetyl-beta-D-mannosaminyltransferase